MTETCLPRSQFSPLNRNRQVYYVTKITPMTIIIRAVWSRTDQLPGICARNQYNSITHQLLTLHANEQKLSVSGKDTSGH